MKKFIYPFFIFFISMANAQVGVNTTNPHSSSILDVTSTEQGFLKPRMTSAQRVAIPSPATGLEVYDTNTNSSWYFNGTIWINMGTSGVNIYNSDGALTGNRIVTQGANTLAFTTSVNNGFSVDGTTFSIDALNNRVGIGTTTPSGGLTIVNDNTVDGLADNLQIRNFGGFGYPLISLGTSMGNPASPINLSNGQSLGGFFLGGRWNNTLNEVQGSYMRSFYRGNGTTGLTDLQFGTSNTPRVTIDENGKVGIGTPAPSSVLDVMSSNPSLITDGAITISSVNTNFKSEIGIVFDGNITNERWMHFNANWSGQRKAYSFNSGANELLNIFRNGNVGIGVYIPTSPLHIVGDGGSDGTQSVVRIKTTNSSQTGNKLIEFLRTDDTEIGRISRNGASSINYSTTSDTRLKTNIEETHYSINDVLKIKVADYNRIGYEKDVKETGFLAQQLYEVYPQAVSKGGEDTKTNPWMVDYGKLTPLLVKAIQEQQEQLIKQQNTIYQLLKRVEFLENK